MIPIEKLKLMFVKYEINSNLYSCPKVYNRSNFYPFKVIHSLK